MTPLWDGAESSGDSQELELDGFVRRLFGRYELLTKLGSGGQANVYLARVRGPGGFAKLVALKCIHPHLADDTSFVEMFLDEARIAAAIDHPNVCSAFDFGQIDGTYYLAMDFLAGESFSQVAAHMAALRDSEGGWVSGEPIATPGERIAFVARIVADAAEGLHAAHEAVGTDGQPLGVIHRDIALPNLFLRYDGQVELVDFGCAKAANRIFQTETGKVRGHVAYMAPEVLRAQLADRRSDIWSLGVALWELLACERLFRRTAMADTMFAIVSTEVPPPSSHDPAVPPELDAIVARALDKDPDRRYQTARELADDLSAYLRASGQTVGPAELECWMRRLFPGGRERLNRLLEEVESASEGGGRDGAPRRHAASEETRSLSDSIVALVGTWRPRGASALRTSARAVLVTAVVLGTLALGPAVLGEGESAGSVEAPAARGEPPPVPATGNPYSMPPADLHTAAAEPSVTEPVEEVGPRPEPPPPARPQTGRVNVLTPGGWADVMLEGRRLGPTPGQFTLPAGSHRLLLIGGDSGERRWVTVDVRAGRVTPVVVQDL